jgi:hypothetical protein
MPSSRSADSVSAVLLKPKIHALSGATTKKTCR